MTVSLSLSFQAQLTTLPEGNTDLGQLLVAAKIDLTLDDIVVPPLTQVKRVMEQKQLTEWQTQLCIKIRRRKKNTVGNENGRVRLREGKKEGKG